MGFNLSSITPTDGQIRTINNKNGNGNCNGYKVVSSNDLYGTRISSFFVFFSVFNHHNSIISASLYRKHPKTSPLKKAIQDLNKLQSKQNEDMAL